MDCECCEPGTAKWNYTATISGVNNKTGYTGGSDLNGSYALSPNGSCAWISDTFTWTIRRTFDNAIVFQEDCKISMWITCPPGNKVTIHVTVVPAAAGPQYVGWDKNILDADLKIDCSDLGVVGFPNSYSLTRDWCNYTGSECHLE